MTVKKKFSEKETDDIVISQADNDSAWEEPNMTDIDKNTKGRK